MSGQIGRVHEEVTLPNITGRLMAGDFFKVAKYFPAKFVDLLILDPPYNLNQ